MIPDNSGVVGAFPNLTIDLIIRLSTYKTINSTYLRINQNDASVYLDLGDGLGRILPLTVSVTVYNNLSTVSFSAPNKPGLHATGTGTNIQIVAATQVHTKNTRMWREYQETDKELKHLLLGAVGDMHASAMKN